MRSLKINSRTIKTAIYTIAILITIGFAVYPKTNSYFLKDVPNSIAYTSILDSNNLNGVIKTTLSDKSTIDTIRITLDLKRDERYLEETNEGTTDKYTLKIENQDYKNAVCRLVPESKQDINITDDNKITFSKNKTTGKIDIECDVRGNVKNKQDINIRIKMYESINDEDRISYGNAIHTEKYVDYFNKFGNIIYVLNEDKTQKHDNAVYNEFLAIVRNYHKSLVGSNIYIDDYQVGLGYFEYYVEAQFTVTKDKEGRDVYNAKEILFESNPFAIKGVSREEVNDAVKGQGYAYTFEDSFIGYTVTHDWYINDNNRGQAYSDEKRFYFSTTNKEEMKEEIAYVLEKYIYKDSAEDAKLVADYIDSYIEAKFDGVYSLENLAKIPGMAKGQYDIYPYLKFEDDDINVMQNIAYNYMNIKNDNSLDSITIRVNYADADIMKKVFTYAVNEVKSLYPNNIFNNLTTDSYILDTIACKPGAYGCADYGTAYYNYADATVYGAYVDTVTGKNSYNNVIMTKGIDNPFNGSEKLVEATKCNANSESNCDEKYVEAHYEKNGYYSVYANVDKANNVNTLMKTFDYKGSPYEERYKGSELLLNASKCIETTCPIYTEIRYYDNNYLLYTVTPYGNKSIITSSKNVDGDPNYDLEPDEIALNNFNIPSIIQSLYAEQYLGKYLTGTEGNYYEVHYDGSDYVLLRVSNYYASNYGNQTIITVSKLQSDETIKILKGDFNNDTDKIIPLIIHSAELLNNNSEVIKYLDSKFNNDGNGYNHLGNTEIPEGYNTGTYTITGIK